MNIINQSRLLINLIRIWPHLVVFLFHPNRTLIKQDVESWKRAIGLNLKTIYAFLFLLANYPEFRNVFYVRFGMIGAVSNLFDPK